MGAKKIFKSNVNTFKGETKIQKDGAPIGLTFSHETARVVMGELDGEFVELKDINNIKTEPEKRYDREQY